MNRPRWSHAFAFAVAGFLGGGIAWSAAPAGSDGKTGWHTVAAGETMSGIARMFGVDPLLLLKLNPEVRLEQLAEGHRLKVPCNARAAGTASSGRHVPAPPEEVRANRPDDGSRANDQARPSVATPSSVQPRRPDGC